MALLIGSALYMYNDWRTHTSQAAPLQAQPIEAQDPLHLQDQSVNGTVTVNPDGTVTQAGR